MYIYYITCYYTTISLSTLYYKKYCKNTNTLFFPGCSTVVYIEFWWFLDKKERKAANWSKKSLTVSGLGDSAKRHFI